MNIIFVLLSWRSTCWSTIYKLNNLKDIYITLIYIYDRSLIDDNAMPRKRYILANFQLDIDDTRHNTTISYQAIKLLLLQLTLFQCNDIR